MAEITCLQVGNTNWAEKYTIPEHVEWIYLNNQTANQEIIEQMSGETTAKKYDVLLLTDADKLEKYAELIQMMDYYRILYDPTQVQHNNEFKTTLERKFAYKISLTNDKKIISDISLYFFKGQYGHRLAPQHLNISPRLPGKFWKEGMHEYIFEGEYGPEWIDLGSYRETLYGISDTQKKIQIFLEYHKIGNIQIKLVVNRFNMYSGKIGTQEIFLDNELTKLVEYGPVEPGETVNYNLYVKGTGRISIGNLQLRYSRGKYGVFTLGGKNYIDEYGHELITFFNPADYKPPLCVYFGGYRTAGGFEGYQMMKNSKSPFMLIEDSSAEGGGFYRGSKAFEEMVIRRIQEALEFLGFTNKDLVLSGLSMGTHAAMYYGAALSPHSIIICKPIANLKVIVDNNKLKGAGIFPTSFDVTKKILKVKGLKSIAEIDQEFWQKFTAGKLKDTQIYVTYMKNEDYDDQVYHQLVEYYLKNKKIIYIKGIAGRHNDYQDQSLASYFYHYGYMLRKSFNRGG